MAKQTTVKILSTTLTLGGEFLNKFSINLSDRPEISVSEKIDVLARAYLESCTHKPVLAIRIRKLFDKLKGRNFSDQPNGTSATNLVPGSSMDKETRLLLTYNYRETEILDLTDVSPTFPSYMDKVNVDVLSQCAETSKMVKSLFTYEFYSRGVAGKLDGVRPSEYPAEPNFDRSKMQRLNFDVLYNKAGAPLHGIEKDTVVVLIKTRGLTEIEIRAFHAKVLAPILMKYGKSPVKTLEWGIKQISSRQYNNSDLDIGIVAALVRKSDNGYFSTPC